MTTYSILLLFFHDFFSKPYLGGCLQIPRRGLLWAIQRQMTQTEIAVHFHASEEMVRFRSNVTGVNIR